MNLPKQLGQARLEQSSDVGNEVGHNRSTCDKHNGEGSTTSRPQQVPNPDQHIVL